MENPFRKTVPWFAEEIGTKELHSQNAVHPGLSLAEWMNRQRNAPITNSTMQPDYSCSLPGPVLQNLTAADMALQLGLQAQIMQQNTAYFNAPRPPQQVQQLDIPKPPVAVDHLGSVDRLQQELHDINQLQMHHLTSQALIQNQNLPKLINLQTLNQVQQQQLIQNYQPPATLSQNQPQQLQQEQLGIGLNQQPNQMLDQLSHQGDLQLPPSEQQIKLQFLQKVQQPFLSQPLLQQAQLIQLQKQRSQFLETLPHPPQNVSLPSQQQTIQQHMTNNAEGNVSFSQSMQHHSHQKMQNQQATVPELPTLPPPSSASLLSPSAGPFLAAGRSHSGITDDAPSCSTSPSTNNSSILPQSIINRAAHGAVTTDDMVQTTELIVSPGALKVMTSNLNLDKNVLKNDIHIKPSMPILNSQIQGMPQASSSALQMEYFDTPSSGASVCLSHPGRQLHQIPLSASLNPSPMLVRDTVHNVDIHDDPRNSVVFGTPSTPDHLLGRNIESEKDIQNHLSESILTNYGDSKEIPQEPSSAVSESLGVLDMEFNNEVSVDPTINYSDFMKGGSWAQPPPQLQPMRTFTKLYKRGAVGRSVDIARYSGYDELTKDLAHRFGIEGQLEDGQKIGWKLVYVDHENDVLLLGDDPWEEFVNCVRCIKILSPQEVQQMSLDGDFENSLLQNQASSRL